MLLGKLHILSFIEIYVKTEIPIGLPSIKPSIIPKGTVFVTVDKLIELKLISELKKAKSGSITNPVHGCNFSSRYLRGEKLFLPILKGIVDAKITPATVV